MTSSLDSRNSTPVREARPEVLPAFFNNIPDVLQGQPNWVVWRYVWNPEKKRKDGSGGRGDWDKVPFNARTGTNASSTDPSTWCSLPKAADVYRQEDYDGVGFVLSKELGLVGGDLDRCRDPETGRLEPWAAEIVEELKTYTELSPSGTGVRLVALGRKPDGRCRKGPFEIYDHARYLTITGHVLPDGYEKVRRCPKAIARVCERMFGPPESRTPPGAGGPESVRFDDVAVIEKARAAKNGEKFSRLWAGDAAAYPSHSEARFALLSLLAFWTRDPGALDRLYRKSGLYANGDKAKWDRVGAKTISDLLAGKSERWAPSVPLAGGDEKLTSPQGRTDLANGKRFAGRFGDRVRWCHPWGKWLAWDGKRWKIDGVCRVERYGKAVGDRLWDELAEALTTLDAKTLAEARSFCKYAAGANGVKNLLVMARSEPGIPVLPEQLDTNPFLLNVRNGTLNLRTGGLKPHDREDYITKLCPVSYDAAAGCPVWEGFLGRVLDGNRELIAYLRRVVGYSLTGDVSEQCMWFLHGSGANGKSTFLRVLLDILGDYAIQSVAELFVSRSHESHPTERADLFGKRLVATIEVDQGKRIAESIFKQLTGGDKIRARRMREDFWEFDPTHKLYLAANHKPVVRGTDLAMWRRIKLVPFNVTIPPAEQDKSLPDKLRAELPGILAWAVRGCLEWQNEGLGEPAAVRAATEQYRSESDLLAAFLADRCVVGDKRKCKFADLYAAYKEWSGDRQTTRPAFIDRLKERGLDNENGTGNVVFTRGVDLVPEAAYAGRERGRV